MAKIVDKEQKKQAIALACKDLVLTKGLHELTVSQMAEAANIGKGTIYEYFNNKEEIVFELARILIEEHISKLQKQISKKQNTREKIKAFSAFFYDESQSELREIYKQFIALTLLHPKKEILEFNAKSIQQYHSWLISILEEGVEKKELKKEILDLGDGFCSIGDGMFIKTKITDESSNLQQKIDRYIDAVFDLMEQK